MLPVKHCGGHLGDKSPGKHSISVNFGRTVVGLTHLGSFSDPGSAHEKTVVGGRVVGGRYSAAFVVVRPLPLTVAEAVTRRSGSSLGGPRVRAGEPRVGAGRVGLVAGSREGALVEASTSGTIGAAGDGPRVGAGRVGLVAGARVGPLVGASVSKLSDGTVCGLVRNWLRAVVTLLNGDVSSAGRAVGAILAVVGLTFFGPSIKVEPSQIGSSHPLRQICDEKMHLDELKI